MIRFSLLVFFMLGQLSGIEASPLPSTPSSAPVEREKMFNIKEVSSDLPNPIWLVSSDLPIVSVSIGVRGAGNRSAHQWPGLILLLTAMLNEGTESRTSQDFKKFLKDNHIFLSFSSENDNFLITLKTTSKNLEKAFSLLKECLYTPRFSIEDLERVKAQIMGGLNQSLHDPQKIAKEAMAFQIYGEASPYYEPTQKILENLPSITPKHLKDHMKERFTQSRLFCVISGGIKEETIKKEIVSLFKDLPEGKPYKAPPKEKLRNVGTTRYVFMDIPQTFILFFHPSISRFDPDFYALCLAIQALGGTPFESRLWHEVRENRGLAYFINSGLKFYDLLDFIIGTTGTTTETVEEVLSLIKSEYKKMIEKGIKKEELEFQKSNITGEFPLFFNSTSAMTQTLLSYYLAGLTPNYIEERNNFFEKLTVEDINKAIKRILDTKKLTFVVVGRQGEKNVLSSY